MPLRHPLALAVLLLPFAAPLLSQSAPHLIPMPRSYTARPDVALSSGVSVTCDPCSSEDQFAAQDLRETLAARGLSTGNGFRIVLQRRAEDLSPPAQAEGYRIQTGSATLTLTGATAAGVFYAAQTVKQMIEPAGTDPAGAGRFVLHAADILDWPAMTWRGLSDDLSRGPVDTLDFQKKLIRTLAAYKANLYSPYFEHTQQYASNPLPAPPGGSISADDARVLAAYAKRYHVTVVPEQEAFGHLRHTLAWEQYQPLAETPHGAVLAPSQPGSLEVIKAEFTELTNLYPSPFLHVGADETDDLGLGQTKAAVDAQGLGKVYLDFMQQIDTALRPLNRRLLFWGDIAQHNPDLLKAMPDQFKRDTIAIGWQYNPRPEGFAKYLAPYKSAGFETWVAPGINNWNRVYPNYNNGLQNIQQFTRDGQAAGSTGQLNTIWYDDGEALASSNWYGILFGAAAAWQPGESSIEAFQSSYGRVFHGDLTGKLDEAQRELMAAHALLKPVHIGDASDLLFWSDPWARDQGENVTNIRPVLHDLRLHAERALTLIAQVRASYPCVRFVTSGGTVTQTGMTCGAGTRWKMISTASDGADTTAPAPYDPADALPSSPTSLREPDAIDALELGARRIDFIGLKFQLADEIAIGYARAAAASQSPDKKVRASVARELSYLNGVNGRIQDIKDGYSLLRDLYQQMWLRTNRPYALRPTLEHYDYTIGIWLARMDRLRTAQRTWDNTKSLPSAAETGIPAPPPGANINPTSGGFIPN